MFYPLSNISVPVSRSQKTIGEPEMLEEEVVKMIAGKECFLFC